MPVFCTDEQAKALILEIGRRMFERQYVAANDGNNSLHSGPNGFHLRLWNVYRVRKNAITLHLVSPQGDQGFPGKADIYVTYSLEKGGVLRIRYDGLCDSDTVFNLCDGFSLRLRNIE